MVALLVGFEEESVGLLGLVGRACVFGERNSAVVVVFGGEAVLGVEVVELDAELVDLLVGGSRQPVELLQQLLVFIPQLDYLPIEQGLVVLILYDFGLQVRDARIQRVRKQSFRGALLRFPRVLGRGSGWLLLEGRFGC